jgi:aspartate carbamoyltransferase catalytic subunit
MKHKFQMRSVISMRDFSKEDILMILDHAKEMKGSPPDDMMRGKLMASCFFEPSTRTRLSFEAAMKRLGGSVIGFAEARTSSASKKESLHDSIKVIGEYADVIVIRHPLDGAAQYAAEATKRPVINAGDGSNQHPTQTLLDLFTIRECQNRLEGLHIAFAGDLKFGRTVHSLVQAAAHFNMRMYFIAPSGLEIPKQLCDTLKRRSVLFSFHHSLQEIMPKLDIVYMTRIQEERIVNGASYSKDSYTMKASMLDGVKPTMKIMHPLPRVNEIDLKVDDTPYAHYFEQSQNGVNVRQALLSLILKGGKK